MSGSPASPVTVLVVDDQPVFLRAARDLLRAGGEFRQVGEALSGAEALALAATLDPDLVLIDIRMPDMDGLETARRLRTVLPDAVLVLTSLAQPADINAWLEEAEASAHIGKHEFSLLRLREVWADHGAQRARQS